MAVDEALASSPEIKGPILRLYRWQPWTISIGFHQKSVELDLVRCREAGLGLVRRPTGGRAILHAHEVTYSVVLPYCTSTMSSTSLKAYDEISAALTAGLSRLNLPVAVCRNQASQDLRRNGNRLACFASSAKYELQLASRKLVGSAQRRFPNALLQHGSILLGEQHLNLTDYMWANGKSAAAAVRQQLREKTVTIETILARDVTYDEVAVCIKQGFEGHFGITLQDAPLTFQEKTKIDRLRPKFRRLRRTLT